MKIVCSNTHMRTRTHNEFQIWNIRYKFYPTNGMEVRVQDNVLMHMHLFYDSLNYKYSIEFYLFILKFNFNNPSSNFKNCTLPLHFIFIKINFIILYVNHYIPWYKKNTFFIYIILLNMLMTLLPMPPSHLSRPQKRVSHICVSPKKTIQGLISAPCGCLYSLY